MRDFRKLKIWEKAHYFTLQVYKITKNFPSNERFGLMVQDFEQFHQKANRYGLKANRTARNIVNFFCIFTSFTICGYFYLRDFTKISYPIQKRGTIHSYALLAKAGILISGSCLIAERRLLSRQPVFTLIRDEPNYFFPLLSIQQRPFCISA